MTDPEDFSHGSHPGKETAKKETSLLKPTGSIDDDHVGQTQECRNGQFHRSFSPRQVHIISLGSNIGSGVFIATGKALATGGPGNMLIAYAMVCSCVWGVLQSLSEMTIAFPVSGNYIDFTDRWVDPSLAFGAGFAEWLGWTAIVAAEAGFFDVLVQYWAEGSFPQAATITLFLAACLFIFVLPNKVFAWFEYVTSLIKIVIFLIIILLSLALVLGAGPNGYIHRGETWTTLTPFLNGFSGFANCVLLATWAVGDQVFIGIMGGEAESPRFSMAHATKLVPFRVNVIYILSVVFITILVPSDDDRLLGGSGIAASPFVIAIQDSGIPGIASLLNAGMMCGILGLAAESIYISSRVLRSMSHQRLIPERLARVDDKGRPRLALMITSVVAVILAYIQLASGGLTVLNWLISITSASFFSNWIIIAFTNWRFHCALKAQNDPLFTEIYAWKSSLWPLAPAWLMLVSLLLLVCCITSGIVPAYRRSMGTAISKGLISGSIDASLEEIDQRSQEPSPLFENEMRVGPFAVLDFTRLSSSSSDHTGLALGRPMNPTHTPPSDHGIGVSDPSSYPVDIPGYADDLLQLSDLFGEDCYGFSDTFYPGNHIDFSRLDDTYPETVLPIEDASLQPLSFPHAPTTINILGHASLLLKNFQKNIVPQMTVVPLAKSPWNILNVPAALVTLGELSIMESESVSHARQANLYSLLACSAVHLAMDSSSETGSFPRNHWKEVSKQAYQDANTHLKISLNEEAGGAKKAKLKDQLMAVYGLTEFAIFSGQYMDARRYLVEAERLLRFRALSKQRISQKLRLLINVYVWLRLIGESTYVLHSYTPTGSFINNLNMHCEVQAPNAGEKLTAYIAERGRRIDDFLHLQNSEGDLNIDEPKDCRMDVPDIHLHDSRKSTGSLCQQVYGMPETMLSLVSQTTRLANVMETLRNAQALDIPINSHVWGTLRGRNLVDSHLSHPMMYGLYHSTGANILEFLCFYLVQNVVPATLIITTRKFSPLRYLCIPGMIWIASRFIRPFGSSGSPTWCQAITQLVIASLQATNLLLLNPLADSDIPGSTATIRNFGSKLIAAFRLLAQTRAVNTQWQVKNMPSHPRYYLRRGMRVPTRGRFLLRQLAIVAWQCLVLDIVQTVSLQQAAERGLQEPASLEIEWIVPVGQWAERIVTHLSIWFVVNRLISDLAYRVLSIFFVGIGSDSPADWPPAFGRMADAFTLRNFWAKFWHQFMRQPFTSVSNFIARDVLRLTRSSTLERYTNLSIVFLISAIFHVIVDILQSIPVERSGSMPFYLAFIIGIMLEDGVQNLWKRLQRPDNRQSKEKQLSGTVPLWRRAAGMVWVMLWLGVTSTWYFTPMIQSTNDDMRVIPFSVVKYIGFQPLIGITVGSGVGIAVVFEVEL
ncbi:hypothetical protein N7524_011918 [Penicillium chrysogenum]|nr:hypothetical protein N7524_011918 [Penicillium chrysogenum]